MLKKFAPSWGPCQTAAVQHLKRITQHPFPLKIPTKGQHILQTDASDEYWGAVLLEKLDGKESYCAHASGQPSSSTSLTLISSSVTIPVIFMNSSLPNSALTRKSFPCDSPTNRTLASFILHKQEQAFGSSFVDCENCILREKGKLLVKLYKNCVLIHTLAGEYRLSWETDRTNFNHHRIPPSISLGCFPNSSKWDTNADSQDPYEDFTPVPSPSPYELYGSSSSPYLPFSTQPEHFPQATPLSLKARDCLWPCVPGCSHLEKIFKKDKDPSRDPDETDSSASEDASISL
ncbi:hypothetical protein WN943_003586 [Citrus x changshan-huyou]